MRIAGCGRTWADHNKIWGSRILDSVHLANERLVIGYAASPAGPSESDERNDGDLLYPEFAGGVGAGQVNLSQKQSGNRDESNNKGH
jgi:hypothetical protein